MFDTSPSAILDIISHGENVHVEFKTRFVERAIARHLTAFANSGGGILIIGVDERNDVLGLSREEGTATLERLQRLAASLLPPALYKTGTVPVSGKLLVYIVVEEAPDSDKPIRLATGDALGMRDGVVVELETAEPAVAEINRTRRTIDVFVAMSFREEEKPSLVDYYEAMKRAAASTRLPLNIIRIDELKGDYEISQRIMDEIDKAQIVLADFTLSPANVYFELGYARGKEKRIIQTARKNTILEFDARNWRTLFYKNATELEKVLIPVFTEAYAEVAR